MTSDIHSGNFRSVDNKMLQIPSFKTSCYGNSLILSAAKLWTKISYAIRTSLSLTIFKSHFVQVTKIFKVFLMEHPSRDSNDHGLLTLVVGLTVLLCR